MIIYISFMITALKRLGIQKTYLKKINIINKYQANL